jgi:hypothetical protein
VEVKRPKVAEAAVTKNQNLTQTSLKKTLLKKTTKNLEMVHVTENVLLAIAL